MNTESDVVDIARGDRHELDRREVRIWAELIQMTSGRFSLHCQTLMIKIDELSR